jgi:hypothetical protein
MQFPDAAQLLSVLTNAQRGNGFDAGSRTLPIELWRGTVNFVELAFLETPSRK